MVNLAALFAVGFVIVLGILSVFAISAHGEVAGTAQKDTFGNTPPAQAMVIDNSTSNLAIRSTDMMMYIPFLLIVCVTVIAASVWLWNSRRTRRRSGY